MVLPKQEALDSPERGPCKQAPSQVLRWQAVRALRLHKDTADPTRSCLEAVEALMPNIPDEEARADLAMALVEVIYWCRNSPTLP